jgi:hypothetical protein
MENKKYFSIKNRHKWSLWHRKLVNKTTLLMYMICFFFELLLYTCLLLNNVFRIANPADNERDSRIPLYHKVITVKMIPNKTPHPNSS